MNKIIQFCKDVRYVSVGALIAGIPMSIIDPNWFIFSWVILNTIIIGLSFKQKKYKAGLV